MVDLIPGVADDEDVHAVVAVAWMNGWVPAWGGAARVGAGLGYAGVAPGFFSIVQKIQQNLSSIMDYK